MKAKFITFVRGLMNGTPPRFQSYLKSLTLLLGLMLSVNVWGGGTKTLAEYTFESGTTMPTNVTQSGGVTFATKGYCFDTKSDNIIITPTIPSTATKLYVLVTGLMNSTTASAGEITISGLKSDGSAISGASGKYTQTTGSASSLDQIKSNAKEEEEISFSATNVAKIKIECSTYSKKYIVYKVKITYDESASSADSYTIQYALNGGTHGTNHPTSAEIGTAFAVSPPTKANHIFEGWSVTSGLNTSTAKWGPGSALLTGFITSSTQKCIVNTTNDIYFIDLGVKDANVTLTANWKENPKRAISWSVAGSVVKTDNNVYDGTLFSALTAPEVEDAAAGDCADKFMGWATAPLAETDPTGANVQWVTDETATSESVNTFYAVFADEEGGGTSPTVTKNYSLSSTGWSNDTKYSSLTIETGIITATASNSGNNGKFYTSDNTWRFYAGDNGTLTITATTGYELEGITITWKSTDNGTLSYNNSSVTSGTEKAVSGQSAVFTVGSSSGTKGKALISAISVKYHSTAGGKTYSNYVTSCATKYSISANAENGSILWSLDGEHFSETIENQVAGTSISCKLQPNTGYKANGAPTSDDVVVTDMGEGIYGFDMPEKAVTVSATFTAATYQISYNLDGGEWTGAAGVASYTYGTGATLPTADDITKANNTFLGWFLNNTGEEPTTAISTTETGNKSFTARWLASGSKNVTINGDGKLTYTPFKPTTVNKDAKNLTIDYSIEKGYTISTVTVTVDGSALTESEVVFSDEQLVITPTNGFSGDVTIAFMVMDKLFNVTWMANKTQFKQEEIQEGNKVTLPATNPVDVTSGEDTYKFQGWITDEQYSSETIAPVYITNNTIEPTGDVTYYAVYAIEEKTPSTSTYTRVTGESQLQTASSLVIVNNSASKLFTNALGTATAPTESNGEITVNNTDMWSLSYANSKYTISNASGTLGAATMPSATKGNYNKPISITSSNNSWTIAESGIDLFVLKNANNVGIEYYNNNWVVYINDNIAGVEACAHKLYIPKMINTAKNYRTRVAVIDHIAVHGTPIETKFVAGETFDATGLSIDVYYQGEGEPENVTTGFTYAPTGALKTTDENITFSYQGKQVLLPISVSNTVSSIEVTNDPTKMEYTEGEQFNPAGMEVTATYNNEAERVVTGYTYTPTGDLALNDKITISFGGQITDLTITINEATKTTVNWYVEGNAYTAGEPSTAVIPGKKVTVLPTEPNACQGNQFVGWTTNANYYNATTAPSPLFKTLADAPVVGESETNYYAVFAQVTSSPIAESTVYTSNISDITGKKVKIANTEYDAIQLGTSGTHVGTKNITIPTGTTTLTLHAASWNNSSDVTLTASTEATGVIITPSTAVSVVENTGLTSNSPWTITPDNTNEFFTFTLSGVKEATSIKFENNNEERVVIWGVNASTTIMSDYSTTCLAALAAPTITTAEGEYCGSVDVEITQPAGNPEGAKIMYSTDNTNWSEYTAAVNITTSGTVYAKVVKDPKSTDVVSATYTIYPEYNLTQAATAATDASQIACLTFSDLLVQARTLSEAFLKASDGQIVLLNKYNHGLSVGDKLVATDAHVTFVKAHDLLQLTSVEGIAAASTGNATTPEEKAITALVAADYGKLVKILDVTYYTDGTKFVDENSNEIVANAKFFVGGNLPSWPDGGKFNVTGIVLTNGESVVIAPRNTEDLESLATPLATPTNFAVASVNSYQASYSWTAVDGNNGYTLYIYDGDNQVYKSNTIGSTRTDYAPTTALEAGHTYTAKLVALGNKATSSDSPAAEVEFTTNPNAQLNWYVGGTLYQTTNASQEKVVTPEDPESPCATNYENFVTWYTEEIVSETGQITALDAAKKVKAGDAAASQAGSAKEYNFYAVFGKIKTAGTDKYVKVTEAQDNWKGEYLIGYDEGDDKDALTVFDGSLNTLDATNNNETVSFESDGSIAANETNNGCNFKIEKSTTEGYYTIQSASGIYIANTTNGNKLSESTTTAYKNTISWSERIDIATGEHETASHLSFNSDQNQMRFRYYISNKNNIVLYKRTKTNPQYSGYITTCPVTYTITIAENAKGLVEAATTTEILAGASVRLTATANAGYTKTGGAWVVKKTATSEVVEDLVGGTNYLTMPAYDVTVDYDFQEIKDQFVDNLHGNTTIEKGGANYELPTLSDFSETTGKPSDAFTKFIGWSATSYDSGEPATEQPTILEGNQTATGATYFAVWFNQSGKYITEYCQTSAPENLHLVEEYHKATSVRIDWNNVDGADKYHIIVMDSETEIIADADVTESLYDLSGLTPGATYICTVKAHKDCWSDETEGFEFTTKENIQSYAVTINAEGGTYTIDPELVEGKIQEGKTVTISNIAVTDATTHFFKELTVPEATDLTEKTGGYKFTMPGKAVTINIVFAEYPKVTWKMEGAADVVTSSVRQDNKFVVGTVQSAPADWKYNYHFTEFAGWMTNDDIENPEFVTTTTEVPVEGLVVNGAVATNATKQYQLVTDVANLAAGDELVIVGLKTSNSQYYAAGDITDNHNYLDAIEIAAPENNIITIESEDVLVFTLGGTTDAWTFKANDKYLSSTSSEANKWDGDYKTWKLSNSSTANMVEMTSVQYTTGYFEFNMGAPRFRNYKGSQEDLYFYRYSSSIYDNLTIDPQPDYGRTDLVVGNYGTVCVPYDVTVANRQGATFWSIETSNAPGYTNPTSITIVEETDDLVAGKPYIFCATSNTMSMFFSGDKYEGTTSVAANGLYGNLTDANIIINNQNAPDAGPEPQHGYFFVLQQKLYECGWNCTVSPNRGWVQAAEITDQSAQTPPATPRRVIGNPNVAPTNLNGLNGNIKATKVLRDGQFYILRDTKTYNAQGQFVK